MCMRDRDYWLTNRALVFDVFVEDYGAHRVMRQFGLRQEVPVPVQQPVPDSVHAFSRKGVHRGTNWGSRMNDWVGQWEGAL